MLSKSVFFDSVIIPLNSMGNAKNVHGEIFLQSVC